MHWNNLLHPERALAIGAKLFLWLLAFILVSSVALQKLAHSQFSVGDSIGLFAVLMLVSVGAYLIREHRMKRRPAVRSTRGAERTPVMEGEE